MDARSAYLLAASLALGLGAFAVAAEVYARYLARRRARVLDAYAVLLLVAVALGAAAMGWRALGGVSLYAVALALPMGLLLGESARRADRLVMRRWSRRCGAAPRGGCRPQSGPRSRPTPSAGALLLGGGVRREPGAHRGRTDLRHVDPRQFSLMTVLIVAVAEEAFYRGVLLQAALLPSSWVSVPLVAGAVTAFALTHLTFGWGHVLAKAPLGLGATAVALGIGSILPAVVAHGWFNLSVWRDLNAGRTVAP